MHIGRIAVVAGTVAIAATALVAAPAQANGKPVIQQVSMPASGNCANVDAPTTLNWGGVASGGWKKVWGQWANSGKGDFVCGRTLVYSNSTRKYSVQ